MKARVYYSKVDNPGIAEFDSKKEAEDFEAFVRAKGYLTKIEKINEL